VSQSIALPPFEDAAACRFFDELRAKRLAFPKCARCTRTFVPPRSRCSRCLSSGLEWVDAPRRGSLYAFTCQEVGLRFVKPQVLGVVELLLEDGPARIVTRIDAQIADLVIGMELELDFVDIGEGVTVHQFRPVGATKQVHA
jgi:uncharacterized protein